MGTIRLPRDFSEFLKLLNSNSAKYLLVGGYAVNYYGYSRATGDMDIWISREDDNIRRVVHSSAELRLRQRYAGYAGCARASNSHGCSALALGASDLDLRCGIRGVLRCAGRGEISDWSSRSSDQIGRPH